VVEVPVLPAGAIHGSVLNPDGSAASGFMLSVIETESAPGKPPGGLGEVGKDSSNSHEAPARFIAQPLPLGGKYLLIARRGKQFAATQPIAITEKEPIREIALRFVEGEPLIGRVTDQRGQPLRGVPLSLNYGTPYSHGFGVVGFGAGDGPITDDQGRFRIEGLNNDLPGSYQVIIDHASGYQPATVPAVFGKPIEIQLTLGLALAGKVVNDSTGKPLSGAHLWVLAVEVRPGEMGNMINAIAPSDKQGRFEFTQLGARDYRLHCREGEIVSPHRKITIPRGSDEPFTVRLKPHAGARLWENGELVTNH
jgi:hypothetical protein